MSVILPSHMEERLLTDRMLWLVSVRPDGRPHSAAVWFLWEDAALLIFSKPNTQKIRNLRQNSQVVVMLDDTKDGSDIITLEGVAELLERAEVQKVLPAYSEKYRDGLRRIGVTMEQFTQLYSQPIRVTPTRLVGGQ